MLKRSSNISKYVSSKRMRDIMAHVGLVGIVSDKQTLLTSKPNTNNDSDSTQPVVPEVWRDRATVSTQLTSTPEARSLTSL